MEDGVYKVDCARSSNRHLSCKVGEDSNLIQRKDYFLNSTDSMAILVLVFLF